MTVEVLFALATGVLLILMQAGFAMVETGLTRSKNATHTVTMSVTVYAIGVLAYYAVGFALMNGGALPPQGGTPAAETSLSIGGHEFGLFSHEGFFLAGRTLDAGLLALFLSQSLMANVATTIPTGAMAERWRFSAFALYAVAMAAIVYPVFGNWVWGGGWLAQLGANFGLGHGQVDFAGSSVIHMTGGVAALVGCRVLGPRIGKYNRDGSLNVLLSHSVPLYMVGTLILAVGWFGLNAGQAVSAGAGDLIVARVVVNTLLASAAGAVAGMGFMWFLYQKPDPSFICNGLLAGLVAISAGCAFVTPGAAVFIGLVAGVLVVRSVLFFERSTKLRLDDPVGAISVHGVSGAWGVLAVGLFADGTYGHGWNHSYWFKLPDGKLKWLAEPPAVLEKGWTPQGVTGLLHGNASQFWAECIGLAANVVWVGAASYIIFKLIGAAVGNRVPATTELQGLDIPELGVVGYVTEDPMAPKGGASRPPAEPRPAAVPASAQKRYSIVIDGVDPAVVKTAWNDLCQPKEGPEPDFLAIYSHMTLLKGNRFRFSGGEPEDVRVRIERLLSSRLPGRMIRAKIED